VQKGLAPNSEQAGIALAAGAIVLIQPRRVSDNCAGWSSFDSTRIPVDCYGILRAVPPREDFPMARNSTRSTRLEARLSPETLAVVKRAAEIEGRSVSDFVVAAAREAAQRTIAETHVLHLALADQQALAEALGEPPKPVSALRRARTAHRRLIAATR
jgi:uncharacterized protein (DUF1778 family)